MWGRGWGRGCPVSRVPPFAVPTGLYQYPQYGPPQNFGPYVPPGYGFPNPQYNPKAQFYAYGKYPHQGPGGQYVAGSGPLPGASGASGAKGGYDQGYAGSSVSGGSKGGHQYGVEGQIGGSYKGPTPPASSGGDLGYGKFAGYGSQPPYMGGYSAAPQKQGGAAGGPPTGSTSGQGQYSASQWS